MLELCIDIHAPTVLVPQKSDSPNLLVLSLGDLSIENFFKEISVGPKPDYVDNILVRLSSLHMTRAIILLDGSTQPQESILEPVKLNIDIKRALTLFNRNFMEYEIRGAVDLVKVNIGQRDLSTIIAIFKENLEERGVIESHDQGSNLNGSCGPGLIVPLDAAVSTPLSPPLVVSSTPDPVKKLEHFLTSSVDVYKKSNAFFSLEGLHLALYTDTEDAQLSSPVRDPLHALSKLELEELTASLNLFSDQSLEVKCSLQSLLVQDTRTDSTLIHTRVVCSCAGGPDTVAAGISVSSPNMVDITYRETASGDATVDVLVAEMSLRVSVPYLLALAHFFCDALPPYSNVDLQLGTPGRLPSSGHHYWIIGAHCLGLSCSLVLQKPEIIFFADPRDHGSQVIALKVPA
ncbi:hypothetical protein HPB52_024076 [Rhipicephalus sanguineus]|uniref:VPS13-like middle region domain-containing protein n=1 Tax=Rhipicephalus sanguineus TaxID=34632 RepID=A0A9D4PPG9_RHISA|nr:hypothetical protein HPB52_024076 [Rhipicephalus sanguineus]